MAALKLSILVIQMWMVNIAVCTYICPANESASELKVILHNDTSNYIIASCYKTACNTSIETTILAINATGYYFELTYEFEFFFNSYTYKLCEYDGNVIEKHEIYASPLNVSCESPKLIDNFTNVSITCRTKWVFPHAKCMIFSSEQNIGPLGTYVYVHNKVSYAPTCFQTECTWTSNIANFEANSYNFSGLVFPDIENGENYGVNAQSSSTLVLTKPKLSLAPFCYNNVTSYLQNTIIKPGDTFMCTCFLEVIGNPPGRVQWIDLSGAVVGDSLNTTAMNLSLSWYHRATEFQCTATSALKNGNQSISYTVSYYDSPKIISFKAQDNLTIFESGTLVEVYCEAIGYSPPTLTLSKDNELIYQNQSVYHFSYRMIFSCRDTGMYTCQASNSANTEEDVASMKVFVKCPLNYVNYKNLEHNFTAQSGESISVDLHTYGYPDPASYFLVKNMDEEIELSRYRSTNQFVDDERNIVIEYFGTNPPYGYVSLTVYVADETYFTNYTLHIIQPDKLVLIYKFQLFKDDVTDSASSILVPVIHGSVAGFLLIVIVLVVTCLKIRKYELVCTKREKPIERTEFNEELEEKHEKSYTSTKETTLKSVEHYNNVTENKSRETSGYFSKTENIYASADYIYESPIGRHT